MRILICSSGNVHQLLIYAKSFSKIGHEVLFLNPSWRNPLYPFDERLEKHNIVFMTYNEFDRNLSNHPNNYKFDIIFSPNHSAVVHSHKYKQTLNIPVLQQILDIPTELFKWKSIGESYRNKHKPFMELYPKMDALTGINIEVPRQIEELYSRKDCHYVPYLIDTDLFDMEIPRAEKKQDVVFCISRLEPYKGVEFLIKACHLLDYNLMLAGHGGQAKQMKNLNAKLKSKCSFLGAIKDDEKAYWLKASRIVVYPQTWNDAPGIVSQEALYCETVPVCFGYESQKVLDGHWGIYADLPPSTESLTEAIRKAWKVGAVKSDEKIKQYVKDNLSGDVITKKILDILESML